MVSFGVPGLDDAYADQRPGLPILLENEPGVDARPFLLQAVARELASGGEVVYVTTDRPPRRILEELQDFDAPPVERLIVLDGHSPVHGVLDPDHRAVDLRDIDHFDRQVKNAQKARPTALFVLDSLHGFSVRAGPQQLVQADRRFRRLLQRFPHALVSYTRWDRELDPVLDGFPNRVLLQAVHHRITTSQYFRVERIAGQARTSPPVLYRAEEGAVRVYVPKVLVTGPADAGKSTFVHAVSDHAVSADRGGATVALDRGSLDRHGIHVQIFGTPGQERFDPMIVPILRQAVGIVLVVDSSQPASFERGSRMLELAWRTGLHAVVAANKQDLDEALALDVVQQRLRLPAGVPIVGCQATDAAQAIDVLDGLLHRILSPVEVSA